eukprot:scaffold669907_cov122-Prasinocladus_malaysianus.AAC.1
MLEANILMKPLVSDAMHHLQLVESEPQYARGLLMVASSADAIFGWHFDIGFEGISGNIDFAIINQETQRSDQSQQMRAQ